MKNKINIEFLPEGTLEELTAAIDKLTSDDAPGGIIILACENNQFKPDNLNSFLKSSKTPVFGGIFPGVIFGNKNYEKGTILMSLEEIPEVHVLKNVGKESSTFYESMLAYFTGENAFKTIFVFVDGLSQNNDKVIESLFISFGLEYNFIGAGAGSLSMEPIPCIITNEGLLSDAAVIAGSKLNGGIGIKHGWKSIAGPFRVTGAEKNTLISLDFKPAFEIYKSVVEWHSGKKLTAKNFGSIAQGYPVGISRLGSDKIVRDPVKIDNYNNMVFIGDIPDGSYIHIMSSTPDELIVAAEEARNAGTMDFNMEKDDHFMLLIDCISRVMYLGDRFGEELNAVYSGKGIMAGTLSMGEIANNRREYLELYNKTAVVGCFNTKE